MAYGTKELIREIATKEGLSNEQGKELSTFLLKRYGNNCSGSQFIAEWCVKWSFPRKELIATMDTESQKVYSEVQEQFNPRIAQHKQMMALWEQNSTPLSQCGSCSLSFACMLVASGECFDCFNTRRQKETATMNESQKRAVANLSALF